MQGVLSFLCDAGIHNRLWCRCLPIPDTCGDCKRVDKCKVAPEQSSCDFWPVRFVRPADEPKPREFRGDGY